MRQFMHLIAYALIGVFGQNILFGDRSGIGQPKSAAARRRQMVPSALLVSVFSLTGMLGSNVSRILVEKVPFVSSIGVLPPILFLAAAYGLIMLISNLIYKPLFIFLKGILPGCAFNSIVMLLGLAGSVYSVGALTMAVYAAGTGLAFLIATLLVAEGKSRIENPDMCPAFSGMPSLLIYVGILAMLFDAF